ncbi:MULTISPECIES: restriction endonuclease subunit S [Proteus]|uniref:restriction endonuclease subunit S n=1 Tax=Proteus TaxID=583 RepID=UPI0013770A46|nr:MULTISPECIES: restriction endonuclease subunit S [Proteus]NBL90601.1 restriction endonuclease subunit S [Proteus sp. G2673]
MSADKKVPDIRFKGFSEEWVENNLGNLIEIRSAARVHKEQWTEVGVPFFRTSDVVSIYKGQENNKAYISHTVYRGLSEKIGKVTKDDLLITGGGSIGIPYLVPNDEPLYFKDADLLWLKNNKKFNGYFLYSFFFSEPFKKHIKSISHTGTIAHYTIEQAKTTPINTCSDKEQTQIGNYFQKLDNLINQHQQKHDKLSNIKKTMLEKMFPKQGETVPKIRFKGFSEEWSEKGLGEVFTYERPDNYIVKSSVYSDEYQTPVLTANKGFLLGYTHEKSTYNDPSIIFDDFTLDCKFVDFPYMVKSSAIKILTIKNSTKYDLIFAFYLLNTAQIEVMGHARHYISIVQNTKVSIPKKNEQIAIGNYFQKLDELINQHQQQITKLNHIKQACLSKMFI